MSDRVAAGMPMFPAPDLDTQLAVARRQVAYLESQRWLDRPEAFGYRRRVEVGVGAGVVMFKVLPPSEEGEFGVEGPTFAQIVAKFAKSGWRTTLSGEGTFSAVPGLPVLR